MKWLTYLSPVMWMVGSSARDTIGPIYHVHGGDTQIVEVELKIDEKLQAEPGAMLYMTDSIKMTTKSGGFWRGFRRLVAGENFFVAKFECQDKKGKVAFGSQFPSKIYRLALNEGFNGGFICRRGAFLCGSEDIEIDTELVKNFGVGIFGSEGFVLQRLKGTGEVCLGAGGVLTELDLGPDEVIKVSGGCLLGFSPSVSYDITRESFANALLGGSRLFLVTLRGPGKVVLQSHPGDRVVQYILDRMPRDSVLSNREERLDAEDTNRRR